MKLKVDEILIKDFQRQDLCPGSERNGSKKYSKALKQSSKNPLIMAKSGCHSVIQYTYSSTSSLACFKTLLPKANKMYLHITLAIAVINALSTLMHFQKHALNASIDSCPHSSFDKFSIVHTKASSTLMRFRLKTHTFRCVLAFRPHWFPKRFHEKHRFENALESGSKRKRTYIVLMWTVENGRKRIEMKTMTENIEGACVCSMPTEFNVQF